jgi:hypothetical protein
MTIAFTREIADPTLDPALSSNSGSILENHPTQSATTINGWGAAFFGLPFLAVGVGMILAALRVVDVGKHVPYVVVGIFGALFFLAGAFFLTHGLLGVARKWRYLRAAAQRPGEPWLYDFHWHQEGVAFSAFNAMMGRLVAALVWSAFLVPFFWIGLNVRGAMIFAIFASLFGLVGLVFWYRWLQMLADLIRYGNSFLGYDSFPYYLGGTLRGRLRAPHHVEDIDALTLTLRCVQEKYVTTGSGKDRSTRVVCYELYKEATTFERERLAGYAGAEIPVEFHVPADQPTTNLAAAPPIYWEIQACGNSSKINYEAYFLVPVYKAQ